MNADGQIPAASDDVLLRVTDLKVHFPLPRTHLLAKRSHVNAVDGVSFEIKRGTTFGIVGESGSGKSTTALAIMRLVHITAGTISLGGDELTALTGEALRLMRRRLQIIFQDPYSSLNPRMRVGDIIGEPFYIHDKRPDSALIAGRVHELLDVCGLPRVMAERYPHEMSGGQRQRVGIARAIALKPEFIVCDEPVSALDVSIQAQIINLLEALRQEFGLTYLFIGHDLSVVKHLCHRVAVMYLGKLVEVAESDTLFDRPRHPYTRALLAAVPVPDPASEQDRADPILAGEVPSPLNPPSGWVFHPRCDIAVPACRERVPALQEQRPGHHVACPEVAH